MLQLVFAYGHFGSLLYEDVDSHEGGVGEQAGVHALVCGGADNLFLEGLVGVVVGRGGDAQRLAGLVFERGGAHKLAYAYVHIEKQVHLGNFGYIALHEYCGFFGVETGGEIFRKNTFYIGVKLSRVRIGGESVQVGNEEVAVVVVLYCYEFAKRSIIITKVKIAGGADTTQHYFFVLFCHYYIRGCFECKINNIIVQGQKKRVYFVLSHVFFLTLHSKSGRSAVR